MQARWNIGLQYLHMPLPSPAPTQHIQRHTHSHKYIYLVDLSEVKKITFKWTTNDLDNT